MINKLNSYKIIKKKIVKKFNSKKIKIRVAKNRNKMILMFNKIKNKINKIMKIKKKQIIMN